jgi:glutamate racemase
MSFWVITDSGLGGLSIAARCMQMLEVAPKSAAAISGGELVYVNAVPHEDRGYNTMTSRAGRLKTFRALLQRVNRALQPEGILIACHSLSLFLPELKDEFSSALDLRGVVESTRSLARKTLADTEEELVIFATPATVAESVYKNALTVEHPEWAGRIHEQACPELASALSADAHGDAAHARVEHFVREALARIAPEKPVCGILGCTHYGYRADFFQAALTKHWPNASHVLDPNEAAALELTAMIGTPERFRFISPYPIPEFEMQTVSGFLQPISATVANAFRNGEIREDWSV